MKALVIANQKGGVAKTTTAGAVASLLSRQGNRVLAIDMDSQGSLTKNCGIHHASSGVYSVLKGVGTVLQGVQNAGHYDVLPSSDMLKAIEAELSGTMGKEYRLREALNAPEVGQHYDFVVIDTPPAIGTLSVNALVAADYVLIPAMADINAIDGIRQLNDTIRNVRKYFNPTLQLSGILLTRFDPRLNISKKIRESAAMAAEAMGTKLFETHIRATVAVPEASYMQEDLLSYDPGSTVAQDYIKFMDELKLVLTEGSEQKNG